MLSAASCPRQGGGGGKNRVLVCNATLLVAVCITSDPSDLCAVTKSLLTHQYSIHALVRFLRLQGCPCSTGCSKRRQRVFWMVKEKLEGTSKTYPCVKGSRLTVSSWDLNHALNGDHTTKDKEKWMVSALFYGSLNPDEVC